MKKKIRISLILSLAIIFGCFSNVFAQNTRINYNNKSNENHYTGLKPLSNDEFKKHETDIRRLPTLNGKEISRNNVLDKKIGTFNSNSLADNELPSSYDNSTSPYFPPILNQGQENDCGVFADVYYQASFMESEANNKNIVLSPQFVYNLGNLGFEQGASEMDIFDILEKHGCATIQSFPYYGSASPSTNYLKWPTDSNIWREAINYRIDNYSTFDMNMNSDYTKPMFTDPNNYNLQIVKDAIAKGYILSCGTNIFGWKYAKTNSNEPICTAVSSNGGGWHGMCIVGYNDNIWTDINGNGKLDPGEKGAFKVINPWGTDWGETGGSPFCWLAYDALNKVSAVSGAPNVENRIFALAETENRNTNNVYTIWPKKNYSPKYLVSATVDGTQMRNRLSINIYIKEKGTKKVISKFEPHIPNEGNSEVGYAFDGTDTPCKSTFVFDITDQISQIDSSTLNNDYLDVEFKYDDKTYSNVSDVKFIDGNGIVIDQDNYHNFISNNIPLDVILDFK